jgi:signal transduction histidine kinase
LAGAAIAIFAALALAWVAMTLLFGRQLEERAEQELRRHALQLASGLSVNARGALQLQQPPTDPRFYVPSSGLYWQISNGDQALRSRSLWDQTLIYTPGANSESWRTRVAEGPFGGGVFLLERVIHPSGSQKPFLIQVGLNEQELRQARAEFGTTMAVFLFILGSILAAAAWLQVYLGLRPLRRLRGELTAMLDSAAQRLSGNYPREVEPLTRTINELAAAREEDVKLARQRAADLAHGLKTPLAALAAQSRRIREGQSDPVSAADGLDRAIAAAASAVEAELARARAAINRRARWDAHTSPADVAKGLVQVLERTEKGMRLTYDIDIDAALVIRLDARALNEILGPLLENAVRFAKRRVLVSGGTEEQNIVLTVEDDGPGIPQADAAAAMNRGARLDEAGSGHGLGLAISRQLVEATGGNIALDRSMMGGLRVELRWSRGD